MSKVSIITLTIRRPFIPILAVLLLLPVPLYWISAEALWAAQIVLLRRRAIRAAVQGHPIVTLSGQVSTRMEAAFTPVRIRDLFPLFHVIEVHRILTMTF